MWYWNAEHAPSKWNITSHNIGSRWPQKIPNYVRNAPNTRGGKKNKRDTKMEEPFCTMCHVFIFLRSNKRPAQRLFDSLPASSKQKMCYPIIIYIAVAPFGVQTRESEKNGQMRNLWCALNKTTAVKVRRHLVNIDQNSGWLVRGHSDLFQSFFVLLFIDIDSMQKICLFLKD